METKNTDRTERKRRDPRVLSGVAQDVRSVLDQVRNAVAAADVSEILKFYDKDARLFDVRDSLEHRDLSSFRAYWEECFRVSKKFHYDLHDVQIDVSGDLAVCAMLSNCRGIDNDGQPIESWLRVTECLRLKDDGWKVVHEHVSVPGDFVHGKLLENLKPGVEVNHEQHRH